MDQQRIGRFIAELRAERGLTQAELGEKLGVTNKTVSRWENGNYMPDISIMQSLCGEFAVGINELLSGRRLGNEEFREEADSNLMTSMEREKAVKQSRRWADGLFWGATGAMASLVLGNPSGKSAIVALLAIALMLLGRSCWREYEKHLTGQK